MADEANVHQLIGHLFRHEAGRMTAVLTRFLGAENLDAAEDLVQDTLLKAMEAWRIQGVPNNPSAWLYKVAHNKAIDWVRRHQNQSKILSKYQTRLDETPGEVFAEDEIRDSVLRMMFACCHPSIPVESQIALTLKTLGGLGVLEIARAFLTTEETIAKRIYRAKEKIKEQKIKLDPPSVFELPQRLNSLLHVLYLLFNEGYYTSSGDALIREDLCAEAMRLNYLLINHSATNLPKVNALMALMCLQSSRFEARTSVSGEIILLEHQDRNKWNQMLIQKGLWFLEKASTSPTLNEYLIEASIASVHALAKRFEDTSWDKLIALYDVLLEIKPSPIVRLNRAIAIGYAFSAEQGIKELQKIEKLEGNGHYYVALGNFYLRLNDYGAALTSFQNALAKTFHTQERELIEQKIILSKQGGLPNGTDFPTAL
ncbi:MAG: sigma-70 family RNA polymerase sigma factor [Cyclobacteriaceae bacterium]|nr:sigma-70 family RNA polymerase sigma factor [Cyclobacteriaceae bacterium]